MATLAGYAYFSAEGRRLGHGDESGLPYVPPVADTVQVRAIYSDGSNFSLGSGTYWAASEYYQPGAAYGYEPPPANPPRGDPYWDGLVSSWYYWTGTGTEFWDLKYGISNPALVHPKPNDDPREYTLNYVPGDDLLSPDYYDVSGAPGPGPVSGKEYIAVLDWVDPSDEPTDAPLIVYGLVELTDSLWGGPRANRMFWLSDFFVPSTPSETPAFWTSRVGTKETL